MKPIQAHARVGRAEVARQLRDEAHIWGDPEEAKKLAFVAAGIIENLEVELVHSRTSSGRAITDLSNNLSDAYKTIRAMVGDSDMTCPSLDCPHEAVVKRARSSS